MTLNRSILIAAASLLGSVAHAQGRPAATYVTVVSPTKVVVSAPAGTGAVYVRVTASGGVSARSPAGLYRY